MTHRDEWFGSDVAALCRRHHVSTRTRHVLAGHGYHQVDALREDVVAGRFMKKRRVGMHTYHEVARALILEAHRH